LRRLIIIGSKGSDLALLQENDLKKKLSDKGFISEVRAISTKESDAQDLNSDKTEARSTTITTLYEELASKRIDIAVHFLMDLPTTAIPGLVIGALSKREDPSDLLLINNDAVVMSNDLRLKDGATIGTSSLRRQRIIKDLATQVTISNINGNTLQRIQQLKDGSYDAIILASAEVHSLDIDLEGFQTIKLNPKEFAPAAGQGVIAYQCRAEDTELRKALSTIHDKSTSEVTNVERKVLKLMDGSYDTPLGVYVEKDVSGYFHVWASYAPSENAKPIKINLSQSTSHQLAEKVVEQLRNNNK